MKEKYKYSVFKHLLKSSFLCIPVSRVIKIGSHLSRMSCAFDYCRIVVFQARSSRLIDLSPVMTNFI